MENPTCPYCGSPITQAKRGVRLEGRKTCGAPECRKIHRRALNAKWRAANPDYFRDWKAANPDRKLELNRASRDRHRQAEYARNRARRAANKERYRAMVADWEKRNPGAMSDYRARRRARMKTGRVSTRDWQRICQRYGDRCFYCGTASQITMDHIVPLSRGGRHTIGNVIPACLSCNSSKHDKLLMEWRVACRGAALTKTMHGRLSGSM